MDPYGVGLECYHIREDQGGRSALGMRTRDLIPGRKYRQMPLHLIHHLVGSGVLANTLLIWLALVSEAEDALRGLASQGETIFRILFRVLWQRTGSLLLHGGLRSTVASGFLSTT